MKNLIDEISGKSEIDSIAFLRKQDLSDFEFLALLGKAIRRPELLQTRFEYFIKRKEHLRKIKSKTLQHS